MLSRIISVVSLCAFIAPAQTRGQVPTAAGASVKLVSEGYLFTEGPAADAEGNVYFTDQPNDRILKWSCDTGKITEFMKNTGRANGLYFVPPRALVACADETGQLRSIDLKTQEVTILVDNFEGKLFNGPNDLWVHPQGGIYFTDPFYKRDYWKNRDAPELEKQSVYFLPMGSKTLSAVDDALVQPNGIIGTSASRTLYVADMGAGKTYQYTIAPDGKLTGRKLFCEMGSDGMAIDTSGNVYLTGKGVTVFDHTGKKLGEIPIPEDWTANVTFGGKDHKTLFITAMDSLYSLEMTVAGAR